MSDQARQQLDKLYSEYCSAYKDIEIVLGEGCLNSPLVIVGEAPGKDEIKQGRPFVGSAGKNLNEFIGILGIDREYLYITNVIKYRLGKLNDKTGRIVNRPATMNDIKDNQNWLYKEISILDPQIIVTLGNVPLRAITGDFGISIGNVHGELNTCNIEGKEYKIFPLYHPASIIYNRALKEVYFQDVLKLKQVLNSDGDSFNPSEF